MEDSMQKLHKYYASSMSTFSNKPKHHTTQTKKVSVHLKRSTIQSKNVSAMTV